MQSRAYTAHAVSKTRIVRFRGSRRGGSLRGTMAVNVVHNAAQRRFEAVVDGVSCVLEYGLHDGVMTITHTGVPAQVGGRGYASWAQLREMSDAGMSIQSHGYSHDYFLTDLSPHHLR